MTAHEQAAELLALSAAGLLSPEEERVVKSHLAECAECSARAEEFADLSGALGRLPAPPPPPSLAARTEAVLAAAADRRQGERLAILTALIAWGMTSAGWMLCRTFIPAAIMGWLTWLIVLPLLTVPPAAALIGRARKERTLS